MDGTKRSVTTRLNATCTNCARTPSKENAFCFLLWRIFWRSWLIKWRGVKRLVQTSTTKLFKRLATFTGRKILQLGATLPAQNNVETQQSCWTFSWERERNGVRLERCTNVTENEIKGVHEHWLSMSLVKVVKMWFTLLFFTHPEEISLKSSLWRAHSLVFYVAPGPFQNSVQRF